MRSGIPEHECHATFRCLDETVSSGWRNRLRNPRHHDPGTVAGTRPQHRLAGIHRRSVIPCRRRHGCPRIFPLLASMSYRIVSHLHARLPRPRNPRLRSEGGSADAFPPWSRAARRTAPAHPRAREPSRDSHWQRVRIQPALPAARHRGRHGNPRQGSHQQRPAHHPSV
jgi:hypothetical protein